MNCIFTDFWSFWDLPRYQKGVHWSRFSPYGGVLGGIWGRPWEFLKVSWATKRSRCPQDSPKTSRRGSQITPEGPPDPQKPPRWSPRCTQKAFRRRLKDYWNMFLSCYETHTLKFQNTMLIFCYYFKKLPNIKIRFVIVFIVVFVVLANRHRYHPHPASSLSLSSLSRLSSSSLSSSSSSLSTSSCKPHSTSDYDPKYSLICYVTLWQFLITWPAIT